MKKYFLTLLIALGACGSSSDSGGGSPHRGLKTIETSKVQDPSLVTVSSEYPDPTQNGKLVSVRGSGFLVQIQQRMFVITASHVSQGTKTKLLAQNQELKILGRLYDGKTDIEIFEVEPTVQTQFFGEGYSIYWRGQEIPKAKWVDSFNFVPLNSWVSDPQLEVDNNFQINRESNFRCDLYCFLLHAETLMQPGSSGSPLITQGPKTPVDSKGLLYYDIREYMPELKDGEYTVRGMIIRRERFFSHSSFIPARRLITILSQYLKGERTIEEKLETKWNLTGPVLFRARKDSVSESAAAAASSGNGVSMDGGNGVSMDGGEVLALNEDAPRTVFDQISAFPINDEGKTIYFWIMAMRNPKGQLISYPVWFDMEQYIQQLGFTLPLISEDPENVLTILYARFGEKGPQSHFKDRSGQADLQYSADKTFRIEINLADGDVLSFQIKDKKAIVCQGEQCTQRFDPIVELVSRRNQTYIVDLRGLFFTNQAKGQTQVFNRPETLKLSEEDFNTAFFKEMAEEGQLMKISLRKKRTDLKSAMTVEQGLSTNFIWKLY